MNVQIDRLPVSQLTELYGIKRSTVYDRLRYLGIKPERSQNNSYINASDLHLWDKLNTHLKNGGNMAQFDSFEMVDLSRESGVRLVCPPNLASGNMPDAGNPPDASTPAEKIMMLALAPQTIDALANYLVPKPDPCLVPRILSEYAREGWRLPTSELLQLLGLRSVPKQTSNVFYRRGFEFLRMSRVGREREWKVSRLN